MVAAGFAFDLLLTMCRSISVCVSHAARTLGGLAPIRDRRRVWCGLGCPGGRRLHDLEMAEPVSFETVETIGESRLGEPAQVMCAGISVSLVGTRSGITYHVGIKASCSGVKYHLLGYSVLAQGLHGVPMAPDPANLHQDDMMPSAHEVRR